MKDHRIYDEYYEKNFTQDYEVIAGRSKHLRQIDYELFLNLQRGDNFSGSVKIRFDLHDYNLLDKSEDLIIDYKGKSISKLVVNDKVCTSGLIFCQHRIYIEIDQLLEKSNLVEIEFENQYSLNLQGLTTTIQEQNQYLYSQGEVGMISQIFPCFDQPDLPSILDLSVKHPPEWNVVSNQEIKSFDVDKSITVFEQTPRLPCYLFGIHAGDFLILKNKNTNFHVPIKIFYRKEKKELVEAQADRFFKIYEEGIRYMETYLHTKYPYAKCDLIFCSDYFFYGMENPGCITLEEARYIFERPVLETKEVSRTYIFLHELAHIWFGDYVTINYWNDLYLKEGFATFLGMKCLYDCEYFREQFPGIRRLFDLNDIHPMQEELSCNHSLSSTKSKYKFSYYQNFHHHNSITYPKSGSILQSLENFLGSELFRNGLKYYLQTYQFSNATTEQFRDALIHISPEKVADLKKFFRDWIYSKGLQFVSVKDNQIILEEVNYDFFDQRLVRISRTENQAISELVTHARSKARTIKILNLDLSEDQASTTQELLSIISQVTASDQEIESLNLENTLFDPTQLTQQEIEQLSQIQYLLLTGTANLTLSQQIFQKNVVLKDSPLEQNYLELKSSNYRRFYPFTIYDLEGNKRLEINSRSQLKEHGVQDLENCLFHFEKGFQMNLLDAKWVEKNLEKIGKHPILRDLVYKSLFAMRNFNKSDEPSKLQRLTLALLQKYEDQIIVLTGLTRDACHALMTPAGEEKEFFEVLRSEQDARKQFVWSKFARYFATTEDNLLSLLREKLDKPDYLNDIFVKLAKINPEKYFQDQAIRKLYQEQGLMEDFQFFEKIWKQGLTGLKREFLTLIQHNQQFNRGHLIFHWEQKINLLKRSADILGLKTELNSLAASYIFRVCQTKSRFFVHKFISNLFQPTPEQTQELKQKLNQIQSANMAINMSYLNGQYDELEHSLE